MPKTDPYAPIISEWHGMTRYECPFCAWDTLDEAQMADHLDPLRGRHVIAPDAPRDTVAPFTKGERDELTELRAEVAALRKEAQPPPPPRSGKAKSDQTADGGQEE